MAITITSKNSEKTFNQEIINVGSNPSCDVTLDVGYEFVLTLQYDAKSLKCTVLNTFNNQQIMFKGNPIGQKLEIEKIAKLMFGGSDEFLMRAIELNCNVMILGEMKEYTVPLA
mgnify:CR=1 FL=1